MLRAGCYFARAIVRQRGRAKRAATSTRARSRNDQPIAPTGQIVNATRKGNETRFINSRAGPLSAHLKQNAELVKEEAHGSWMLHFKVRRRRSTVAHSAPLPSALRAGAHRQSSRNAASYCYHRQ